MNEEELRNELRELEKKEDDMVFSLKREFKYLREKICIAHGGHFFYDPVERNIEMVFGYKIEKVEMCRVCKHEKITEVERFL